MKKNLGISPRKTVMASLRQIRDTSSVDWEKYIKRSTLKLFHEAAKNIPAFASFLKKQGVKSSSIVTWKNFQQVPPMSKSTYLRNYPLKDLCWDGTLARPAVFSATSGSTGKPFYFQRSNNLEEEYSVIVELFLSYGARVPNPKNTTLVIIGFGMGVWIGGMLTYRAYEIASQRGYPVSILPAGINKGEILNALRELAPQFTQTIFIGYPPFVKDVLDEAEREKIDLKSLNLRLQFAAESFTEQFRDYVGEKAGIKNVVRDTLNIYGTADIGAMAFETPTSILIRRIAVQNERVFKKLFGDVKKLPTLAQYNPSFMTFESTSDGEILLTGNSAIPLIRYAVGDHGGVLSFDEVNEILLEEGILLAKEAKKYSVPVYELPFVFVYARIDLSTKLYGANIYPEHVREALEDKKMQKYISGKCTIQTLTNKLHDQYLEVHVELRSGQKATKKLAVAVQRQVVKNLLEKNSEYQNNYKSMGEKVVPHITFWPQGDETHFKQGVKQQWVKK